MKSKLIVSLIFAACSMPAIAQSNPAASWEVAAGYNFVHANAPPSGCGCFSMNGGSASVARNFKPAFSLAGEFNGVSNGNVNATGHSLVLLTYLAGPRYRYVPSRGRATFFGQTLLGAAHASGGVYAPGGLPSGTANAFAAAMGGGVDVALSSHVSLRLVEAEYLLTLLPNGVNSRQNNVSLSAGAVVHWGSR